MDHRYFGSPRSTFEMVDLCDKSDPERRERFEAEATKRHEELLEMLRKPPSYPLSLGWCFWAFVTVTYIGFCFTVSYVIKFMGW